MACDRAPSEGGVAPLNKGLSRSDWGLRKMGRPFRAAPERQRGSCKGTEAVEVPA